MEDNCYFCRWGEDVYLYFSVCFVLVLIEPVLGPDGPRAVASFLGLGDTFVFYSRLGLGDRELDDLRSVFAFLVLFYVVDVLTTVSSLA